MRRRIGTSYNKQSTPDNTSDMIVSVNRQITVCTCWQTSSRALHARSSLPSSRCHPDEPSSRFARTNHRLASHGRTIVSLSHGRTTVSYRCHTDEPSSRFARTNHRLVSHGRTIVSFRTDEPSSRFARTNHRLVSHGRTIVSLCTDEPYSERTTIFPLAGPGLSLVWIETYFVTRLSHTFTRHTCTS